MFLYDCIALYHIKYRIKANENNLIYNQEFSFIKKERMRMEPTRKLTKPAKAKVQKRKKELLNVKVMAQIGMLSAIAAVLMLFEIPLWFGPSFYKIDLSELPVLIGSFAIGPTAGVLIELVKILLNFVIDGTTTAGVGEGANFLIGCAFILPSAIIYHRKKTRKGALLGMSIGIMTLIIVGSLLNVFVLLPVYSKAYGIPLEGLIEMGTAVNPYITDLSSFVMFAVVPFNLIKGVLVSSITFILYKKISPIIR